MHKVRRCGEPLCGMQIAGFAMNIFKSKTLSICCIAISLLQFSNQLTGLSMDITLISFHVFHTPIPVLERLISSLSGHENLYPLLLEQTPIQECVLVSTCNRYEAYATCDCSPPQQIATEFLRALAAAADLPLTALQDSVEVKYGTDAARHLFFSVAGLHSLAVGEKEIQGQIKAAYKAACEQGVAGRNLIQLFERALHAGKRARNESCLEKSGISMSTLAFDYLFRQQEFSSEASFVLIGTGRMAKSAARYLMDRGYRRFAFVSHQPDERQELRDEFQVPIYPVDALPNLLADADVVQSAYGTREILVTRDCLLPVMDRRRNRPLYLIDLGMPRDIEPEVTQLPAVTLIDFTKLKQIDLKNQIFRDERVRRAKAIVEEELNSFLTELNNQKIAATIRRLHQVFQEIGRRELEKALSGLGHLDERDRRKIEKLTHNIIQKILFRPTRILRHHAADEEVLVYKQFIDEMLDIQDRERA